MTTDGNYIVKQINTIDIPQIIKGIGAPLMGEASSGSLGSVQFYYDTNYFYTVGQGGGVIYRSKVNDIINGEYHGYAQPGGQAEFFASIYPTPINGYYYNFSVIDDLGGDQGGDVWRAPANNPMAWYSTGITTPSDATFPMIYNDGTNIYLIGGTVGFAAVNTIDVAAVSNPLSWTASGNTLPGNRVNAPLITEGTTIYMYGGIDETTTEVDTIYSADTSDPTTWTNLGSLLPVPLQGAAAYNDGTYIWLFGGSTTGDTPVNTIYRATVGAPTSFTSVGTIPSAIKNLRFFVQGSYAYLFNNTSGPVVYRASLSDLTTWTTIEYYVNALATAVRASHNITIDNTMYMFGGITTGTTAINTIQTANTTNPLRWTNSGSTLPANLAGGQLIKTKNYMYIISGEGTTGNVYRATLAAPTTWSSVSSSGPTRPYGQALIVNGNLFYLGGESAPGTPVTTVMRALFDTESSPTGNLIGWKSAGPPYFIMALPIALSRFTLIVAGNYAYILGGYTTGPTMNTTIYRLDLDNINTGWVSVGGLSNPMVNSTLVLVNNMAYVVSGGPTTGFTTTDDYVAYASLTALANGDATFTEVNTASQAFAESMPAVVDNNIYFIGGRSSTNGVKTIYRTFYKTPYVLISPKVPEAVHSLPAIDSKSGALGSYTSFQRTGLYPWRVTDI